MTDRKEIRVFISSPGDCDKEREAVERVLDELNHTAGEREGLYFHSLRWEDIPPGLGANPQEVIDKQLGEYHALVGIMWMRFGTPIPEGAGSGTEHEVNQAIKSWTRIGQPRVMFYFKDEPIPPSRIDLAQFQKVNDFRERLQKVALVQSFCKTPEFEKKLRIHLNKLVAYFKTPSKTKVPPVKAIKKDDTAAGIHDEIQQYLNRLKSHHETVALAGFETRVRVPIKLEDLYIPLHAQPDLRATGRAEFANSEEAAKALERCEHVTEISLVDAFIEARKLGERRGIVLLGDPGSGKTTHLKRLILWMIQKKGKDLGLPDDIVPVFLPLRDLKKEAKRIDAFVADQLSSDDLLTEEGFGKRLLRRGHLLFLLDGLDEIPDATVRAEVSFWINQAIEKYHSSYFIVTSRYAGYTSEVRLSAHFLELHLRPLKEDQAEAFVKNWYHIVEASLSTDKKRAEKLAKEQAEDLIDRLRGKDFRARRVFEMTRNPLLLTAICLVHRDRGKLPRRRGELYEECVNVLLERWRDAKKLDTTFGAREAIQVLQPLAYWLHKERGRTRANADQMEPILEPALNRLKDKKLSAWDFLKTIRDESGLLTGWSDKSYGFMHLGFQEYLASREIRSLSFENKEILESLARCFGDSWWREVILLLLAIGDPPLFDPFMRMVIKQPAFAQHPDLVEECLDDSIVVTPTPFLELLRLKPGRNQDLWKRQLTALRLLKRLDPEQTNTILPVLRNHPFAEIRNLVTAEIDGEYQTILSDRGEYELILIPGGTFLMGSPEEEEGRYDDEGPLTEIELAPFYLGRHPVTNKEYGRYLKETGAGEPGYWDNRLYNQPNQPVVGISWDEAEAYCEWAGLQLPTEAQWEYACRAGTATRFWSGDKEEHLSAVGWYFGNSDHRLHPVEEKPPNPFGLYDMHGNVWEWCEDTWHADYKGAPTDGSAWVTGGSSDRVCRGGGWYGNAQDCRSADRFNWGPGYRYSDLGFRPASSSQ